jgi:glycosyltransferase involved in cell wall biosynthesis
MNSAAALPPDRSGKLLIISYLFPPAGGIAVQRSLSFTKYLSRLGFEVHVLSAGTAASPVVDSGLLRHVPPQVRIHRAFAPVVPFPLRQRIWKLLSPGGGPAKKQAAAPTAAPPRSLRSSLADAVKGLMCPDPEILWVPFALRKAKKIVKRYGIETVFVTAPPFSAFLAGNALKRRFPHLHLISDFRDDWVGFYLKEFGSLNTAETARRSKQMERSTVEQSDLSVVVTESMQAGYRARYPDLLPEKFVLIPNGYDPESFPSSTPRKHDGTKVVITFAGTVYSASSPRTYLEAWKRLPEELRTQIETRFVGRVAESERAPLESGPEGVRLLGFLPQSRAFEYLQETDYLLLIMTDPTALTGKLFEYMAAGKPILALAPRNGDIARILEATRTGWCVDPFDGAGIQTALQMLIERTRGGQDVWSPDWEAIRRYERPRLAQELADRIRRL